MKFHVEQLRYTILALSALLFIAALVIAVGNVIKDFGSGTFIWHEYGEFVAVMTATVTFMLVLARAVALRQRWARVFGLIGSVSLAFYYPPYLAILGVLLFFAFVFCWKYRNELAESEANSRAWGHVPFISRYGVAAALLYINAILAIKVAPIFQELFSASLSVWAKSAFLLSEASFVIVGALVVVMLLWWYRPPNNSAGLATAKVSFYVASLFMITSLVALYGPIFIIGSK